MGYYKWLFPKIRMIRHGWYLDTTGEIPTPKPFSHVVGQRTETWSEGVAILYNPNAQRDKKHFVGLSQYWLEDGDVRGYAPQFDALTSVTWISNFESVESAQKFDSLLAEKATEFLEKERNVGPH